MVTIEEGIVERDRLYESLVKAPDFLETFSDRLKFFEERMIVEVFVKEMLKSVIWEQTQLLSKLSKIQPSCFQSSSLSFQYWHSG
jgi:hypothetical protein